VGSGGSAPRTPITVVVLKDEIPLALRRISKAANSHPRRPCLVHAHKIEGSGVELARRGVGMDLRQITVGFDLVSE
jgi:hypothetical protein